MGCRGTQRGAPFGGRAAGPSGAPDGVPDGVPDVVGLHEAAEIMGLDPRRVSQFEEERAAGVRPGFPAPAKLACGPIWWRSDVEVFHKARRRTPGPRGARRSLEGLSEGEVRGYLGPGGPLTEREKRVMTRRLGLDGSPPGTLEEVARDVGVSPATVKQTQRRALGKIRTALPGSSPEGPAGGSPEGAAETVRGGGAA